jgi:hypothetical protein
MFFCMVFCLDIQRDVKCIRITGFEHKNVPREVYKNLKNAFLKYMYLKLERVHVFPLVSILSMKILNEKEP